MITISFLKKLEEKVLHPTPLRERISHALYRLQLQKEKLEQTIGKLQKRDQEIFQRCVGATLAKDTEHATIYANECAEIRKLVTTVLASQLALERVILRLQTVEEFGDVLVQVAPIMGIVNETKGRIRDIIPEVANELGEVHGLLNDTLIETGDVEAKDFDAEALDDESKRVLEESSAIAEQRIKEQFPELPVPKESETRVEKIPIAITDSGEKVDIEQLVYDYIKLQNGRINVSKCASSLGTTKEDVRRAIDKLKEDGRIVLQ